MNSFLKVSTDLGFVKIGRDYHVTFPYKNANISRVEMSCDCMSYEDQKTLQRLVITWKPKPVPVHLREINQNYYKTQKSITVHYTTVEKPEVQQVVLLTFEATAKEQ